MLETFTEGPLTAAAIQAVAVLVLIRFLDVWHREPLWLVGLAALWGATGAILLSVLGNEAVSGSLSPEVDLVWGAAISAPIVEELAKGFALLGIFIASGWAGRRFGIVPFNGPTDGIVYGAAVGLGFAFAENNFYFIDYTSMYGLETGFEVLDAREGSLSLGILGHAVYTAAFGAALGLATWAVSRSARLLYPALGLAVAILAHAFHNGFTSFVLVRDYGLDTTATFRAEQPLPADLKARMESTADSAWQFVEVVDYLLIAGLFVALLYWVRHEWRVLAYELHEEERSGLITAEEYRTLTAFGARSRRYWQLLSAGELARLRDLRAYHVQLAELAFAKWRTRTEGWDPSHLDVIRRRVSGLRATIVATGADHAARGGD